MGLAASTDIQGPWSAFQAFVWSPPVQDCKLVLPASGACMSMASAPQYDMSGTGDFTVELQIQASAAKIGTGWLVYRFTPGGQGNGAGFGVEVDAEGNVTFTTSDDQGNTMEYTPYMPAAIFDGKWHDIAAVRQTSNGVADFFVYVDGTPLKGFPSGQGPANITCTNPLTIGVNATGGPQCAMTRIRLWARALAQAEIQQNIAGQPASRKDLVGEWLFTNGTTNDTSSFGNNGTLLGGAQVLAL